MIKAYTNFSAKAARVRGYLSADKVTSEDFPTYFQKALTLYYPLFLDLRVLQENMDSFYAAARKVKKRYPRSVSKQELIKQVGELWSRAWEGESEMYYTVFQRVFSSSAMQRKYETGYQGLQWEHGKLGTEEEYFARTIFYHQYAASYLEILRKICPQHIFSKIFLRGFASETQMSRAGAQCRKFFTFLDIIRELGLWSETVNDYLFLVRYWQEHRYPRIQEIDDLLRSRAKASQLRFTISESSVVSDFSAHFLGAGQYAFLTERVRNFEFEHFADSRFPQILKIIFFLRESVLKEYKVDPLDIKRQLLQALSVSVDQAYEKLQEFMIVYAGMLPLWLYVDLGISYEGVMNQATIDTLRERNLAAQQAKMLDLRIKAVFERLAPENVEEMLWQNSWRQRSMQIDPALCEATWPVLPRFIQLSDGKSFRITPEPEYAGGTRRRPNFVVIQPLPSGHIGWMTLFTFCGCLLKGKWMDLSFNINGPEILTILTTEQLVLINAYVGAIRRILVPIMIQEATQNFPPSPNVEQLRSDLRQRLLSLEQT